MGLFDSTVKQTSTSTGTSTFNKNSQKTNPDWVTDLIKGFGGEVAGLGGVDPNSLVPGMDPLQNQASAGATNLSGTPWNFDGALDLTRGITQRDAPQATAARAKDFMNDYLSPYLKDVVDTTAADFDFDAGRTRAQQDLDLAGSGAFGGSGAALTKSMTEDALTRGRASTLAGLRDQGFTRALTAGDADAGRAQSAAELNAQLKAQNMDRTLSAADQIAQIAAQFGAEQRANIGTQAGIGAVNREVAGEQANAVPDWLMQRIQLAGGLPFDLFSGETTSGDTTSTENSTTKKKSGGSAMDKIGQIAQIAALFASDERLKTDIERIGERPDGLGVYLFRYLWSPARYIGVMAQEVLKVKPEAVVTLPGGYLAVNYGAL